MSNIFLETDRMYLREMELHEGDLLFDLDSDPEVMKYLSGGKTTSKDVCERAIKNICEYYNRYNKKFGLWFAFEKETNSYMGWFLLRPDKLRPEDVKSPELGYRLKRGFWGKGYATEGAKALVNKALRELDCDSVFAVTMTSNLASQNVMKKVGMTYTGEYKQDECFAPGGDTSAVHYLITKNEFFDSQK